MFPAEQNTPHVCMHDLTDMMGCMAWKRSHDGVIINVWGHSLTAHLQGQPGWDWVP